MFSKPSARPAPAVRVFAELKPDELGSGTGFLSTRDRATIDAIRVGTPRDRRSAARMPARSVSEIPFETATGWRIEAAAPMEGAPADDLPEARHDDRVPQADRTFADASEIALRCATAIVMATLVAVLGWSVMRSFGGSLDATANELPGFGSIASPRFVDASLDGRRVAAAYDDGTVAILDASNGAVVAAWCLDGREATMVAIDAQGERVLVGTASDGLWAAHADDVQLAPLAEPHVGEVTALAYVGRDVVSGGIDGAVYHLGQHGWNALPSCGGPVTALAATADETRVAIASLDGTVRVLDWLGAPIGEPLCLDANLGRITALAFDRNGEQLAASGFGGTAVWSVDHARMVASVPQLRGRAFDVAFDPSGQSIFVAGATSVDQVDLDTRAITPVRSRGDAATALLATTKGLFVATPDMGVGGLRVAALPHAWVEPFATCVATNGDGRLLRGNIDGTVSLLGSNGSLQRRFRAHRGPIVAMATDATGGWIATAAADGLVRLWNLHSGRCVRTQRGFAGGGAGTIALSDDGSTIAMVGRGACEVIEASTGDGVATLTLSAAGGPPAVGVAFLPGTCDVLTLEASGRLTRWSREGETLAQVLLGRDLRALLCSPDGRFVAAANGMGQVFVGDADLQTFTRTLVHRGPVLSMAFDPNDASRIVTGGADGMLRVYDHRARTPIASAEPFDGGPVESICISTASGRVLAVGGAGRVMAMNAVEDVGNRADSAARLAIVED